MRACVLAARVAVRYSAVPDNHRHTEFGQHQLSSRREAAVSAAVQGRSLRRRPSTPLPPRPSRPDTCRHVRQGARNRLVSIRHAALPDMTGHGPLPPPPTPRHAGRSSSATHLLMTPSLFVLLFFPPSHIHMLPNIVFVYLPFLPHTSYHQTSPQLPPPLRTAAHNTGSLAVQSSQRTPGTIMGLVEEVHGLWIC
ncbi:hypothetical protein E2C01_000396 [Portunus trituberculatus]|uniref:Uncharacterized protein n=1 Tax=Portunus trituberculatus TaxID=210409 RepID=A0A5B7CE81_PORTR|nr:hypothetical protein [Portunus trituberculatus]